MDKRVDEKILKEMIKNGQLKGVIKIIKELIEQKDMKECTYLYKIILRKSMTLMVIVWGMKYLRCVQEH